MAVLLLSLAVTLASRTVSLACASAALGGVTAGGGAAPLVAWSANPSHLGGGSRSIRPDLREPEVLAKFLSKELAKAQAGSPEVLVLVTGGSLGGSLSSASSLQTRVLSSGASMTVPGVDVLCALGALKREFPDMQVTDVPGTVELVSRPGVASSGDCTVVVCEVSNDQDTTMALQELMDALDQSVRGKFALVVALGNRIPASDQYDTALQASVPPTVGRRLSSSSSTQGVRMTPDILAGLLTGILMTVIALTGLCCLGSIQTPTKFTDVPPPSTREY